MDCKVIWTDPSIEDLHEIVSYIAAGDAEAAWRVGFDIIRTVELLQEFPLLGPPYPSEVQAVFGKYCRGAIAFSIE